MTDQEYRQDDRTDTGFCPICGERVTTVFVDGAGWCPDHGRVWCSWDENVAGILRATWDTANGTTDDGPIMSVVTKGAMPHDRDS